METRWQTHATLKTVVETPSGIRIADCATSFVLSDDDCKANARLIAAAPKLLNALQGLIDLEEQHLRSNDDEDVSMELQLARQALAEATGTGFAGCGESEQAT